MEELYQINYLDTDDYEVLTKEELICFAENDRKDHGDLWEYEAEITDLQSAIYYLDLRDIEVERI